MHVGRDHTIHSAAEGYVYNEKKGKRTVVNIVPMKREPKPRIPIIFRVHPELIPGMEGGQSPEGLVLKEKVREVKPKNPYMPKALDYIAYREAPVYQDFGEV